VGRAGRQGGDEPVDRQSPSRISPAEPHAVEWSAGSGLHNLITRIPPVTPQPAPYAAAYEFNWLTASGTACFFAAIATAIVLRVKVTQFVDVYIATFKQLWLAIVTIASMLGLAYLMNYSGMTSTLGAGAGRQRLGVSVLQRRARMARRLPHRERHVGQCALREPPGRHRHCAQSQSVLMRR